MKIFAVIDNYESGHENVRMNDMEGGINFYDIPDSCVIKKGKPFFVPDFAERFVASPSLAIRIDRLGKSIAERFSHRYYGSVAPALAVIAPDLLSTLRYQGLPWSRAVIFDRSLMLGDFVPFNDFIIGGSAVEYVAANKKIRWELSSLRIGINALISELSRENTLKTGDIILVALNPQTFELNIGDAIFATIGENCLLEHKIR